MYDYVLKVYPRTSELLNNIPMETFASFEMDSD